MLEATQKWQRHVGRPALPRRGCHGSGTLTQPGAAQSCISPGDFAAMAMVCLMLWSVGDVRGPFAPPGVANMHTPRFIVLPAARRGHLLLGFLLAVVACGGRFDDSVGNSGAGGSAAGGAGRGGASGVGGAAGGAAGAGATGAGGWSAGGGVGTGGAANIGGATNVGGSAGTGGATSWTACGPVDGCVLEAVSCCGPGCEPVPLSAFTAINVKSVPDYQKSHPVCPCVMIACQLVAPEQRNVPNYIATCEQGQCKAIDIRTSALTACTSSADCFLRSGTSCCPGCGTDMVAFSNKANVQAALCAAGPMACPAIACAPAMPVGLSAVCNPNGHCVVNYPQIVDAGGAAQ
jgi:hypothetical protein